jgi:hypothetical protein
MQQKTQEKSTYALIINGNTLEHALRDELRLALLSIGI